MNTIFKIIKNEEILVKLKTKSDIGYWKYQLFGLLSLFMNRENDYFIITNKRIILSIKQNVKVNLMYQDFSSISVDTKKDLIFFKDDKSQPQNISLAQMELDYEDYRYLKSVLKTSKP